MTATGALVRVSHYLSCLLYIFNYNLNIFLTNVAYSEAGLSPGVNSGLAGKPEIKKCM